MCTTDLAAAGDWDGLEVEDAPLLRSFRGAVIEQLRRIVLDETAIGDARREASRLAKRGTPEHDTERGDLPKKHQTGTGDAAALRRDTTQLASQFQAPAQGLSPSPTPTEPYSL